jgi:hypothetical protein
VKAFLYKVVVVLPDKYNRTEAEKLFDYSDSDVGDGVSYVNAKLITEVETPVNISTESEPLETYDERFDAWDSEARRLTEALLEEKL